MQECKCFRDGTTLVISLDGWNWIYKRSCNDKWDDELRLLTSSGQMVQAGEMLQPIACFCILNQRRSAAPHLWRNPDQTSSWVTLQPPLSTPPRHHSLPVEPTHPSMRTSLDSFVFECPNEAPWTRLVENAQDFFRFVKKDLSSVTQDVVTKNWHNKLIIFCDEDIPLQLFGNKRYTEDCKDVLSHLKNSTVHCLNDPNNNNNDPERIKDELVSRASCHTCNFKSPLKSCQICNVPGVNSGREKNAKKRMSVSFDDDVIVYLFDKESPTVELHSGPSTPRLRSFPCNLPDVTLENTGLEWEDDFSALEKSCHFQCATQSVLQSQYYTLSLPTQSYTAPSRQLFLSQTCLFLTHVTESDLEL